MRKPETRSFDMGTMQNAVSGCSSQSKLVGEFFNKLSPQALKDIGALAFSSSYPAGMILFSEKDPAPGAYIVLEGEVKLSMNSTDGRRLILRIARKGEILGLASALSGKPCEMTAETLYPAKVAPILRRDFLNFLTRHPEVYRSEERRVGKEGRSRWAPYHLKKKNNNYICDHVCVHYVLHELSGLYCVFA